MLKHLWNRFRGVHTEPVAPLMPPYLSADWTRRVLLPVTEATLFNPGVTTYVDPSRRCRCHNEPYTVAASVEHGFFSVSGFPSYGVANSIPKRGERT